MNKSDLDIKKAFRSLERDINKAVAKLSQRKSCENFGQPEVRAIKDKYFDYLHGNYTTCKPFMERVASFENWCDNYTNY